MTMMLLRLPVSARAAALVAVGRSSSSFSTTAVAVLRSASSAVTFGYSHTRPHFKPAALSTRCLSISAAEIDAHVSSNHEHKPLPNANGVVMYTETDEAPALATYSLYPVLRKFSALSQVDIVPCDISLAGRILAIFPECLKEHQRIPDNLKYLGQLTHDPMASIVKLPNISASLNQLTDCIAELRSKGYDVPIYPTRTIDRRRKRHSETLQYGDRQCCQSCTARRQQRSTRGGGCQGVRTKKSASHGTVESEPVARTSLT